ncbi:hypothetical protein E3N88_06236 [Mikania micrantha]|uniref:Uncharacterized protein n=1 Tax=Mikania micrantha TaxID=192012 RepID=A0A5N6PQI6_9ASTR|nr:hypothetical protein E3N88_06236 [Mikania micrantha]
MGKDHREFCGNMGTLELLEIRKYGRWHGDRGSKSDRHYRRKGVKKTAAGSELWWEKGKKTESPENDCTGARKKDRRQETEAMIDRMA